ncbi:Neprilysin OS=Tsukamurella paurometabola (strain ATCC 8368 / DSM / CCUG 35730 / CIP 100753 /JCM 10117 / KCTC 9821 / NBRC 16120 / NCIMB 702349 / NCTC 13040)OX=521096 GN=Tpau_0346 PE=4 SV=1 [Tsukamurella paurometabola]|uniref:Neprilysin n=1 Tax=Tsukamurella paurometabola (strain ATCC 8368 / DSM 20162 / CCUG 35730 / CIP 100753 / JCM 10117 / KCTC 9821 / NBRC 16120 / NCIMB 702349 / NCTC 13040) TaxID=521096 RepID=D5URD6_TSUPD|nr:M13-type metalloendopeptidase [Tsukamurella paurometabola]ADG76989.1 Neprilysin [Tsukamurella paurometabola DSM 20162]SUP42382.1 Neutral endopeptidase [Tsukamurella paurometabola]
MTSEPALDLSFVDPDIRVQDDLFGHVNGKWLDGHEIPADRSSDGAFYALRDAAELHVKEIVEEAAADAAATGDAAKIGDLYSSFMDTAAIEAAGVAPVADEIAEIRWADSATDLATVLGRLQRTGVGGLLGYYVDTDAKRSDRYLVQVTQSGISLPDEAYYRDEQYAPLRAKFTAHVADTFRLATRLAPALLEGIVTAGEEDAAAASVLDLETAIAAGHWNVVDRRDADKSYNLRTFADLGTEAPALQLRAWTAALTAAEAFAEVFAEVNVRQPSFVTHAAALLSDRPLAQWRTWLAWRVLRARSPYLSDELVAANFAFYGTALTGATENRERWKRGVGLVEEHLGFAVGELYTARHFPADSKARMQALVADLVEAYRRRIVELPWMTPATRERALEKLGKFTPKIGYPDAARDYSSLQIQRDDLLGNVRRGNAAEHDREFAKIGAPVDRDEWFMTPQTVNAYYNPGMNEIVFPAAILQPPFFAPTADDAVNFGGIGAVIGHEIGHGFDDQGAKYDGDGNLEDWWTDTDREEFGKRTRALIEQYDELTPRELGADSEHHVNGGFTVGENIGDLGGLGIALVAYGIARERAGGTVDDPSTEADGLTGLQRVFYSWGQIWRGKSRPEEAIRRLAIDPHSPPEFRCNAIASNLDEFYSAFGVTEGDTLFLAPERRVSIW